MYDDDFGSGFGDTIAGIITTFITDLLQAVFGLVVEILQGVLNALS